MSVGLQPRRVGELPHLPSRVTLREVGPRDGLQGERPVAPSERARLAVALIGAGCTRIEAASFVSERAVPAMAGAGAVIHEMQESGASQAAVTLTALVPNLRGAEAALNAGVAELTVTVAASAEYNERNVRKTIEESIEEIGRIAALATTAGVPVDAVISCAFGSPYEEEIPAGDVAQLVARLLDGGAGAITLADTTGMATPKTLEAVLTHVATRVPGVDPGLHLHETRGTALVNAYAALVLGMTRFDTSIGGLGGSPFAEGAGGNLATEDFVSFLDGLGIDTGLDLAALLEAAQLAKQLVGRDLPSKVRSIMTMTPR
ncbi:MAG: hydroxymethylglutaryl-CoA lyase [Acidimicrobiales bacterium]